MIKRPFLLGLSLASCLFSCTLSSGSGNGNAAQPTANTYSLTKDNCESYLVLNVRVSGYGNGEYSTVYKANAYYQAKATVEVSGMSGYTYSNSEIIVEVVSDQKVFTFKSQLLMTITLRLDGSGSGSSIARLAHDDSVPQSYLTEHCSYKVNAAFGTVTKG